MRAWQIGYVDRRPAVGYVLGADASAFSERVASLRCEAGRRLDVR